MKIKQAYTLTPKRTEYGKAIRKQYENHEIYEQRKNMTQLKPRLSGICGCTTCVEKDNYVLEIYD